MKIAATKLFDVGPVANTQSGKELKDFIDYVNNNFEELIRALSTNLTLEDNLKGQKITVNLTHNQTQTTNVDGNSIVGVIPLKVQANSGSAEAFANLSWFIDTSGKLVLVPQFKLASVTQSRECTLFILKQ